jgi:hypothetical protein
MYVPTFLAIFLQAHLVTLAANHCAPKNVGIKLFQARDYETLLTAAVKRLLNQGCQIFLATTYQNGENIPNYLEI